MATPSIIVEGIDEALHKLNGFILAAAQAIPNVVQSAMTEAEQRAKADCPVDTGHLQSSIYTRKTESNAETTEYEIGATAEYAAFVEYGHATRGGGGFVEPQPFIGPAVEELKIKLPNEIINVIAANVR